MRCSSLVILSLLCCSLLHAQEVRHAAYIGFAVNKSEVDLSFGDNAAAMRELTNVLQAAEQDDELEVILVEYLGTSSPEGSRELNCRLAQQRIDAVANALHAIAPINDSLVISNNECILWQILRDDVAASDEPWRDEVLAVIDQGETIVDYWRQGQTIDERVNQLQRLRNGTLWNTLLYQYFPDMRKVFVVITTRCTPKPEPMIFETEPPVPEPEPIAPLEPEIAETTVASLPDDTWQHHAYVKSNGIGWLMLIANAAFEYEFSPHWSLSVPLYYSALNYFSCKVKFRTAAIQPEIRYWFGANGYDAVDALSGITARPKANAYIGAHLSIAHYNYALGGDYRRQDHDGKTPAWGGGVSGGVRLPISHNGRWFMEFTGGVGCYHLYYDKFINVPNGREVSSTKKTFFCVDNLAVTVAYRWEVKKKAK